MKGEPDAQPRLVITPEDALALLSARRDDAEPRLVSLMKRFDRRPRYVRGAVGWWEWNVLSPLNEGRVGRTWRRLHGCCPQCGLYAGHKMDCSEPRSR